MPEGNVFRFRDGRIRESEDFPDSQDALPAAEGSAQAMREGLHLVRSIYADWERGDFSRADWAHADIEFAFADGPEPGSWSGLAQMSDRYGEWLRGWRDFRALPERYIVVDEKHILVFVQNSARGSASGLPLDQRSVANYFEIHDSKVTRLVLYWDRDRALADLELGE